MFLPTVIGNAVEGAAQAVVRRIMCR